jgi:cytochrome P450
LVHWRTVSATAVPDETRRPEHQGAPSSPAGPVEDEAAVRLPPARSLPRLVQTAWFGFSPLQFALSAQGEFGDVWQMSLLSRKEQFVATSHPDHVESLFKAKPDEAPSITPDSPLRPILGGDSVLTSIGARHMRQRKLLLPAFHGESVQRYIEMIAAVAEREIERWEIGKPFALAPRMQAVTLDVIMSGIFGIEGSPAKGTPEYRLRQTFRALLRGSTNPAYRLLELQNVARREPTRLLASLLGLVDRQLYALIDARRVSGTAERHDVLSLLLDARDEDGEPLTDRELRDELMTLVLAGHETTANSLAWTFERLLRAPAAYERLRESVRADEGEEFVEATIYEGMRVRPVVPMIGRVVRRPWRLGQYVVPPGTPVAISIVALHHRPDVYPEPQAFRPERFVGVKPGTYTWIPFGGGIRRCLGATLAMAEQRVVLGAVARRTDLSTASGPESPRQRNVTMIPRRGGRVVVQRKYPA